MRRWNGNDVESSDSEDSGENDSVETPMIVVANKVAAEKFCAVGRPTSPAVKDDLDHALDGIRPVKNEPTSRTHNDAVVHNAFQTGLDALGLPEPPKKIAVGERHDLPVMQNNSAFLSTEVELVNIVDQLHEIAHDE